MVKLEAIDLNLLLCLGHLLEEGSVSKAAAKMGVTQPAMSHRLTQLRELLDDQLLVRAGRGMRLTPQGELLLPRVRAALAAARDVLVDPEGFDPTSTTGVFRIDGVDFETMTLLEPLVKRLSKIAPKVDVRIDVARETSLAKLANGELDLLVSPSLSPTVQPTDEAYRAVKDLVFRPLFFDVWYVATRVDHPRGVGPISLEELARLNHVLTAPGGGERGFADAALAENGLFRRVVVTTPTFNQAARFIAQTDYVGLLPAPFARQFPGLRLHEPPFEMPATPIGMWWHPRNTGDPRHRWLRGLLKEIGKELGGV